ncbi:Diversity-generating retroelement protein bAvd family protein [Flavobacterium sp. 9AF]|uniref:four helix bundle protein n=1 Tax=Flavobacterium sp. 9AF TaxID=2653142 RepID=UPI0012F0777C|nr:four helix bundle protein [Flavobacterium sp. 9AF]VXB55224.1 Diversity-generating retroelement protein bAvd family protein [Flavobacterium sp. 9AF]
MHRFKDLEIWKLSRKLSTEIYSITANFPDNEKFGLSNQLRRASVSLPSNIAEGCSRTSNKDFSRFLEIAIGSAYEMETQLLIAFDLGYIDQDRLEVLINNLDQIVKMTSKFRSTLISK